jgi:hypothetical protein
MRTAVRWGTIYVLLLSLLVALGNHNLGQRQALKQLQARQDRLKDETLRLTVERYQVLSPLSLRQWAEAKGFVPMSQGNWGSEP